MKKQTQFVLDRIGARHLEKGIYGNNPTKRAEKNKANLYLPYRQMRKAGEYEEKLKGAYTDRWYRPRIQLNIH